MSSQLRQHPKELFSRDTVGVGGSSPSPRTNYSLITQAERLVTWFTGRPNGLPECPYLYTWSISLYFFTIRLHHWLRSDDARFYHNHAWWFITLVLFGSYADLSKAGEDTLTWGSIRFRSASHAHSVRVSASTWTLLITGMPTQRWGFWVNNKLIKRDKYFATQGHHPCMDGQKPVRLAPWGERIKDAVDKDLSIL